MAKFSGTAGRLTGAEGEVVTFQRSSLDYQTLAALHIQAQPAMGQAVKVQVRITVGLVENLGEDLAELVLDGQFVKTFASAPLE